MITFGYLVGEVVRRIAGQSLGTVFREEIAEPPGADFHIGLPTSEDGRVADIIPFALLDVANTRTRAWQAAEIPAVNGHGNARSIAEIHAILANGGLAKGKRFLSEATCHKALEQQIEGPDLVMSRMPPARFGLGFGRPAPYVGWPLPTGVEAAAPGSSPTGMQGHRLPT